ncbi:MAG: YdjY domain-containing protein [Phycisphaerales bacterium]
MRGAGPHHRVVAAGLLALAALASCESGRPVAAPPPAPPEAQGKTSVLERAMHGQGSEPPHRAPTAPPGPEARPATPTTTAATGGAKEALPGIRIDRAARTVEFEGTVPIDCHDPRTPRVYLEVAVCTPDTKEHEALVVTRAKPSDVHAALLAVGLEPGEPGRWTWEDKKLISHPPRGAAVEVLFSWRDTSGSQRLSPATDWVISAETRAPFASAAPGNAGWVFAGSRFVPREGVERYDADGTGTLIGLCTFGTETIAWKRVISPEAEVEEPEWIADPAKVPPRGTQVTVRIRALAP